MGTYNQGFPSHLTILTNIEIMIVFCVHIVMKTFFLGKIIQCGIKGQVDHLQQDTQQLYFRLPHISSDLPVII